MAHKNRKKCCAESTSWFPDGFIDRLVETNIAGGTNCLIGAIPEIYLIWRWVFCGRKFYLALSLHFFSRTSTGEAHDMDTTHMWKTISRLGRTVILLHGAALRAHWRRVLGRWVHSGSGRAEIWTWMAGPPCFGWILDSNEVAGVVNFQESLIAGKFRDGIMARYHDDVSWSIFGRRSWEICEVIAQRYHWDKWNEVRLSGA